MHTKIKKVLFFMLNLVSLTTLIINISQWIRQETTYEILTTKNLKKRKEKQVM